MPGDQAREIMVPGERQAPALRLTPPWSVAIALGAALTIVGGTDLGLMVLPPRFGNVEWEFAIVGNVLDAMPVPTVGLTLLALAAFERPVVWLARVLSIVAAVGVLLILGLGALYVMDIPVAMKMTPPQYKTAVYRALLKSGIFGVTYVAYYSWLAVYAWKRSRTMR